MVGRTASEASGPVRMRKAEAWARMTAYEACWQVCLQAVAGMEKEAECFLLDNCAMLKEAFGLSALALRPAHLDGTGGDEASFYSTSVSWAEEADEESEVPDAELVEHEAVA